jgi:copper chaperone CopZ
MTSETIQVSGIRCERCVARLSAVLGSHRGLESASASLMGAVTLTWDEQVTSRDELVAALATGGFHERPAGMDTTAPAFPTS